MSLTESLIEKRQHFTFSPNTIDDSPTGKREIKIDVPMNLNEDIHVIGQDNEYICHPADMQVHYSFVIFVGMIAYVAGFLTCLYFWPR